MTDDNTEWVTRMTSGKMSNFSVFHKQYWDWNSSIVVGKRPPAFVGIWPRGSGKTSSVEWGAIYLGCEQVRNFCLYVKETQEQANKSVAAMAAALEEPMVKEHYPLMADRDVNKFGMARAWNATQLQTAHGWNVLGYGLDAAARGIKIKDFRPNYIVLDDVDSQDDTTEETMRKIGVITKAILPTGAKDCAIVFIQNLIKAEGVADKIHQGTAGFLKRRIMSGPYPAVYDLKTKEVFDEETKEYRDIIIAGTPSWDYRDLETVQAEIDDYGLEGFMAECQHDLSADYAKRLWKREEITGMTVDEDDFPYESMDLIIVSIDPAAWSGQTGITVAGLKEVDGEEVVFILESTAEPADPSVWAEEAVYLYNRYSASVMVAEKNQGGAMIGEVISSIDNSVFVDYVHASKGKIARAQPVATASRKGKVKLVGRDHAALVGQMITYQQGDKSPDLMDSMVWAVHYLILSGSGGGADVH